MDMERTKCNYKYWSDQLYVSFPWWVGLEAGSIHTGLMVDEVVLEQVYPRVLRQYDYTDAPYSSGRYCYQNNKRAKSEDLQINQRSSRNRERLKKSAFNLHA